MLVVGSTQTNKNYVFVLTLLLRGGCRRRSLVATAASRDTDVVAKAAKQRWAWRVLPAYA